MSDKPKLSLILRPEGFELRDKRSDKLGDSGKWTPEDAVFDASTAMAKEGATSCAVVWRDATGALQFRFATGGRAQSADLLNLALAWLYRQ